MIKIFEVRQLKDLAPVARYLLDSIPLSHIIFLEGEMGTGKTTLVKEILLQKGITEVSSPTFSIVNRYDTNDGPYFHFDLYRIEELEELYDIGIEEYLDSGSPCLIEWPQLLFDSVDHPVLHVRIEFTEGLRTFKISTPQVQESLKE